MSKCHFTELLHLSIQVHIEGIFCIQESLCDLLQECKGLDIQFHLLSGEPGQNLPKFVKERNFGAVVTDFNPLKISNQWNETVKKKLPSDIPFIQVCLFLNLFEFVTPIPSSHF